MCVRVQSLLFFSGRTTNKKTGANESARHISIAQKERRFRYEKNKKKTIMGSSFSRSSSPPSSEYDKEFLDAFLEAFDKGTQQGKEDLVCTGLKALKTAENNSKRPQSNAQINLSANARKQQNGRLQQPKGKQPADS